jgi:outer membrane receptor for Fe3+-dicitrate
VTAWERLTHGFQLSSMVQYYSALPFNITSGVANLQGSTSRPLADGTASTPNFDVRAVSLIPRNAGVGSDFFTWNLRVSRAFRIAGDVKIEGLVEAFNLTDRVNPLTRNVSFGGGAYPANPSSTFNQITAVGDPRTFQFGLRLTF